MAIKTIMVKGDGVRFEANVTAGQTITPGHLVKLQSDGTVRSHNAAGQAAERAFAVEDDLQGKTITDAYAAGTPCQYNVCQPGDLVYAPILNGENISKGDFLESGGNGELQKYSADSAGVVEYPSSIVAVALEALDLSGSVNAGRIQARVV